MGSSGAGMLKKVIGKSKFKLSERGSYFSLSILPSYMKSTLNFHFIFIEANATHSKFCIF